MKDLEKLAQEIEAANARLELAAQQAPEAASAVHMLRLKLASFKAKQEQPSRRRSAA
ncbi:MAG: hypothetical protein ABUS57_02185 [Pseudomonadota bacterium]